MVATAQRVAIVRGPGGLPGIDVHIGAWLALEAAGIRPTWLSGCSAGAIVAALDASGMPAWQAREYVEALRDEDVVRRRFGWKARIFWLDHFCDPAPISELLTSLLPAEFGNLKTPLTVSATRMDPEACGVLLRDGDLRKAVLASMSIAGVWPYVDVDGAQCSDGGTTHRYPLPPLAADPHVFSDTIKTWDAIFVLDPVIMLLTGCGTPALLKVSTDGSATLIQPKDVSFSEMRIAWDPESKTYGLFVRDYTSNANAGAIAAQTGMVTSIVNLAAQAYSGRALTGAVGGSTAAATSGVSAGSAAAGPAPAVGVLAADGTSLTVVETTKIVPAK